MDPNRSISLQKYGQTVTQRGLPTRGLEPLECDCFGALISGVAEIRQLKPSPDQAIPSSKGKSPRSSKSNENTHTQTVPRSKRHAQKQTRTHTQTRRHTDTPTHRQTHRHTDAHRHTDDSFLFSFHFLSMFFPFSSHFLFMSFPFAFHFLSICFPFPFHFLSVSFLCPFYFLSQFLCPSLFAAFPVQI